MRISQLARKLNITPTQIIRYLTELGIDTDKGVNTKLMDAGIDQVIKRFGGKAPLDAPVEDIGESKEEILQPVFEEEISNTVEELNDDVEQEKEENVLEEVPEEEGEPVEVIKPNLVKLQGLKVMGKIELPEPKIKEKKVEDENEITNAQNTPRPREGRGTQNRRKASTPSRHQKREPLSYEEKLKREEQRLQKQRIEEEKKRKEKKRRAYENRLKKVTQTAPKKVQKEQEVVSEPEKAQVAVEKPKTTWGKFKHWLNT